jgi:hypothetical protein
MIGEQAYGTAPGAATTSRGRAVSIALAGRDTELLIGVGLTCVAIALLAFLPRAVAQDTWLALTAGREVAHSGLPSHESLTLFAHGRTWVDQQWLSQLLMYLIFRVGGLALAGVVNVILIIGGLSAAAVTARRLGASARSVLCILPLAVANVVTANEVRTEAWACLMLVAIVYLLARDSRMPSRRVLWCLPLLVLWGNLHGSVILGGGLVVLRGLTLAWERRAGLRRMPRNWLRPTALILGGPLCAAVTPYGFPIVTYYRSTLLNSGFSRFITEWQPVTVSPIVAVLFFLLAGTTIWSFGRYTSQTTLWERGALLATAVLAIMEIRNVEWFGLISAALLPLSLDRALRPQTRRQRSRRAINLALVGLAGVTLLAVLAATFARSPAAAAPGYPAGPIAAIRRATEVDPGLRVFADERYADWLLWRLPSLRGRVAYDARFEQLTSQQLTQIGNLKLRIGSDWNAAARGYRLLILDPEITPDSVRAFLGEPGRRILYAARGVVVILRRVSQVGV